MTVSRRGIAIALWIASAATARAQTIATPHIFGRPVTSSAANSFMGSVPPEGPQFPPGRGTILPSDANGQPSFYPTQVAQAYGLDVLQGGLGAAAVRNNGAGETVAIIDAYNYPNALSTLNTFSAGYKSNWSLPQMTALGGAGPTFTQLNQSGGTTLPGTDPSGPPGGNNWEGEEALDIEYVHAMAPQANIILYEANSANDADLYAAVKAAANNPAVSVVSISWSGPESSGDVANNSLYTTPGTKASQNQGVTFCAATGDSGDINHSPGRSSSGFPATSPNVVAVGGTSLHLTANNSYSSETAWSWNSSYAWAGGGGTSAFQAKPSWQKSYGTAHPGNILATTTTRAEPDVAMLADPNTGVYLYDSYNASSGTGGWFNYEGGTSLATPLFAGLIADADGMRAAAGNGTLSGTQTLTALYSLPGSDFHDITSGNIDSRARTAYTAGPGYDLATGLGSPIANLLVPALANYGVVAANTSVLVASTSAVNFGRVLSTAIGTQSITVGLSSGTMSSTGATAAVLSGGPLGAALTSGTASGAGYITGTPQNWTINMSLGSGLGAHSDTVAIQNTGDSGSGPSGTVGSPPTGNQQPPIDVAVSGTVVSQRTVNTPAVTVLPGTWQGSYHVGDSISAAVAFGYSYPGGGSGSLNDTESASIAAYSGPSDGNGITLTGGPDSVTTSMGFTRTFSGIAAVGSSGGSFLLNVTPELSSTATVTAAYSISVTSGSMDWAGPSGGSWSSGGWADTMAGGASVAPGLNPAWTHSDAANFGSSSGSSATVNLDVSPSLRAITFTGSTSYTLAGAGGTLSLNNGGSGATIAANASANSTIDAPVVLEDHLTVTGSGLLTFAATSSITDNGGGYSLTLNASGGTLVLSGSDSYTGGTFVTAGKLVLTDPTAILEGTSLTVGDWSALTVPVVPGTMVHASARAATVPEPGTLLLAGMLLLALFPLKADHNKRMRNPAQYSSSDAEDGRP